MKKKRPKGKVVLFLVEGLSEIKVLKPIISEIYYRIDPDIDVCFPTIIEDGLTRGGDITSQYNVRPNNIENEIYKQFLKTFFDHEKLFPKDIIEIIHIVDTDGVYIPDDHVKAKENDEINTKIFYGENEMFTVNIEATLNRNKRKRENMNFLSSLSSIKVKSKTIPYSVFYFSSNLDHVLYDNANLDMRSKVEIAGIYIEQLESNPFKFIETLKNTSCAVTGMDYSQSWEFIRQDIHSLHKYTNLSILFDKLCSYNAYQEILLL